MLIEKRWREGVNEDDKSIAINRGDSEEIIMSSADDDVFAKHQLEDAEGNVAYRLVYIQSDDDVNLVVSKWTHFGKIDGF